MTWQASLCGRIRRWHGGHRKFANCEIYWGYLLSIHGIGIEVFWGCREHMKEGERRYEHGMGLAIGFEELDDNCFPFWLQPIYPGRSIYDDVLADFAARRWTGEIRQLRWSHLARWRY